MVSFLSTKDFKEAGKERIARLMRLMGLRAIYPKPSTTKAHPGHKVYPYLLRGFKITRPNQVWSADITYIPMAKRFMYPYPP